MAGYEYQRFQSGAQQFWTPLGFPGQYHDAETGLFQNWNRFYDPSIGRYLEPEPLLASTGFIAAQIGTGYVPGIYSYARSNPLAFQDPTGLCTVVCTRVRNFMQPDAQLFWAWSCVRIENDGSSTGALGDFFTADRDWYEGDLPANMIYTSSCSDWDNQTKVKRITPRERRCEEQRKIY